jgi:GMP synthase-like glutamine amidotransferase
MTTGRCYVHRIGAKTRGVAMKVHVLQHVAFEGLGSIEAWLHAREAAVAYTHFHVSPTLPALDGIDLVIAMGGPMSVNDEAALPWLREEKRFIRAAIECGLPVLGICLGAQLIANALGARVNPGPHKEIGWFDITATPAGPGCFGFPGRCEVFHWHGETFELPPGALRLARSAACENQAFQVGRNVIGLQFHLETTPASAESIIANCRDELIDAPYVQTEAALRAAPPQTYARANALMDEVLGYLTRAPA